MPPLNTKIYRTKRNRSRREARLLVHHYYHSVQFQLNSGKWLDPLHPSFLLFLWCIALSLVVASSAQSCLPLTSVFRPIIWISFINNNTICQYPQSSTCMLYGQRDILYVSFLAPDTLVRVCSVQCAHVAHHFHPFSLKWFSSQHLAYRSNARSSRWKRKRQRKEKLFTLFAFQYFHPKCVVRSLCPKQIKKRALLMNNEVFFVRAHLCRSMPFAYMYISTKHCLLPPSLC